MGLGEVDLGGCLQFGRKRFFRFEQTLIAPGLSQKLLAFRTRLIFFCRLKFSDDDLVQLVDGPMRYGFPAHGPIKTLILVLDQSTLVPYFYGFDQCFLRVRSFGITNWLVRSLVFNRRPPTLLPVAKSSTIRRKVIPTAQSLLRALARRSDLNVPRGAYHPRASVAVGVAYDRFQNQKKLLRKHVRSPVDDCLFSSVAARGL